eukprot:CAMPEP_0177718304 /NCGR_PEP_ID=MMETSP0484_2-20121128/15506_1 /TAXON_ID=354590 /ORGANISM="Rhodomonas lens, Strain RHODO" /LENGTH=811 /DNA_ID=CAMNT_0019230461 /DNA_START=59 /DNA_END=2494 /DNA_ORIENTATION=+
MASASGQTLENLEALLANEEDEVFLAQAKTYLEDRGKNTDITKHPWQWLTKHSRHGQAKKTRVYLSHAHDWICWDHTGNGVMRKTPMVLVSHMIRVDTGQTTTNFQKNANKDEDSRSFSIITHKRSLDLVAETESMARLWVRTLRLLRRGGAAAHAANSFMNYTDEQWFRADTDRSGTLEIDEVIKLMRKMNITCSDKEIKKLVKKYDMDENHVLDREEFGEMMKELFSDRMEIRELILMIKHQSQGNANEEFLTVDELVYFENEFQRQNVPPLVDGEWAKKMIVEITGDENEHILNIMNFAIMLDSSENGIYDPEHCKPGCGIDLQKYMSKPLSEYFINTSHNTYLTGNQLQGVSSVEQYSNVLQRGCRCVELDCWDGALNVPEGNPGDEPIITHGHTLCTKILFRDVIEAIRKSSFGPPSENPYPVILSIEMHCSQRFQDKMYEICKKEFKDLLYLLPDDLGNYHPQALPSPEELKGKILVKGKRGEGPLDDDDEEDDDAVSPVALDENISPGILAKFASTTKSVAAKKSKKRRSSLPDRSAAGGKTKVSTSMSQKWSSIISLQAMKFTGFNNTGEAYQMSSFAESKAKKLTDTEREAFVTYNINKLSRIYPGGHRVNSSNMEPVTSWSAGCQLVALNFQTGDLGMSLNYGRFLENANFGYVLKPPALRHTGLPGSPMTLKVTVLSCQRLPNHHAQRDILDPYVRVEVHGLGSDSKVLYTKTVMDNGFNPVYSKGHGETFEFLIQDREAAMLRICAMDFEGSGLHEMIGQYAVPLNSVRPGFRHVPLLDEFNGEIKLAGILCRIQMEAQ